MAQTSFLTLVAQDLLHRYGHNLNHVTVVFPNKRAGLFLNQELALQSPQPVWTPRYTTMGDLFHSLSSYQPVERIEAVCTLYQIYREEMGSHAEESLDRFYGWGEILLSDFDDIDKHLADARAVFANVHDLQEMADLSFLTPEQLEALRHFFQYFSLERDSELRNRFLQLWRHSLAIYTRFKETLMSAGKLYEGALFREVVERLHSADSLEAMLAPLPAHVVFAGFNVLNDVEQELMDVLKQEGRALFYWDYDVFYVERPHFEAGFFMRQNLKRFGSALPAEHFDNLSRLRDITFVATSSDTAQPRYATRWLQEALDPQANRNAVVLCNEGMLLPLLHAVPEEGMDGHPAALNVTMGFPLSNTPIYSFVQALLSLQTEGYDRVRQRFVRPFLLTLQKHPYYSHIAPDQATTYVGDQVPALLHYLIEMVTCVGRQFTGVEQPTIFEQLYIEAIYRTILTLRQLLQVVESATSALPMDMQTLRRLVRQLLQQTSVPFHGEPAIGLQMMGVLETRCLDFSHLLMLNVEEGNLPKNVRDNSLIPIAIREAFGLTTLRHKVAVYAYYFYRLIQRTSHLTCIYSENCQNTSHHEMSRFLRQLQAETDLPIRFLKLSGKPVVPAPVPLSVAKSEEIMRQLHDRYAVKGNGKSVLPLSPTAINAYIDCPLSFYYRYVAGLKVTDDPQHMSMAPVLGSVFHDTAQLFYQQLIRRAGSSVIEREQLNAWVSHPEIHLEPLLDIIFDVDYFHPIDDAAEREARIQAMVDGGMRVQNAYEGEHIIFRRVMLAYLMNLLRYDLRHTPFTMLGMEEDRFFDLSLPASRPLTVRTGGRIDRMDIMDGSLRIVDYKTGSSHLDAVPSIESLFLQGSRRNGYYLQTMLYALAQLHHQEPREPVVPTLFYVGKAYGEDYCPSLQVARSPIEDFTPMAEEFADRLTTVLTQLFDEKVPFTQAPTDAPCRYCPYCTLCGR